jgi:steroid 5-alpha reductase family enzyme
LKVVKEDVEMSSSAESMSWVDRWWPLVVILFGVIFVTVLVTFNPTT